ncbi:MAG: hypothetical protein ACOYT8_04320 [Candidatus Dependentiae bacterium]
MRYHILLLVALTFNAIQPMDKFKEKLNNFSERITNPSFIDKDKVSEKLSSIGSFLNNGMNRLVELTIRNDNYTTKEKITVCGGAAVFLILLTTSRILKQKSINNQLAQLKKESRDQNLTSSRSLTEEEITIEVERLSEKLDIEYTLNGVLNNLSSKNISNFDDFLISLNNLYSDIEIFLPPHHRFGNKEFVTKCKAQLDKEVKKVVDLIDKNTNNYKETITNIHLKLRLKQFENAQQHRKFKEQLEEMQFAVKHPPVQPVQA